MTMSTQEHDQACASLIVKVTSGQPLSATEKMHMVECESCLAALVRHLDHAAGETSPPPGTNGTSGNNDLNRSRPEAKKALEHARRVFTREFGLS
jgi:hypothetical protein